jgi:hypothetical protein
MLDAQARAWTAMARRWIWLTVFALLTAVAVSIGFLVL